MPFTKQLRRSEGLLFCSQVEKHHIFEVHIYMYLLFWCYKIVERERTAPTCSHIYGPKRTRNGSCIRKTQFNHMAIFCIQHPLVTYFLTWLLGHGKRRRKFLDILLHAFQNIYVQRWTDWRKHGLQTLPNWQISPFLFVVETSLTLQKP